MQQGNGQQQEETEDVVLVPFNREDLSKIKCVKFSEPEIDRIAQFQEWLATTRNLDTGQPFIPRNEHSALVQFCLNYTFKAMGAIAVQMAKDEAEAVT